MSFNISMFVLYGKILFLKNRKIMKGNVGIIVCESNSGSIGLFFYKVKKVTWKQHLEKRKFPESGGL